MGPQSVQHKLVTPNDARIFYIRHAMRAGFTNEEIFNLTKIDPWFLRELEKIVAAERQVSAHGLPREAGALRRLKAMGFSDKRLAQLVHLR